MSWQKTFANDVSAHLGLFWLGGVDPPPAPVEYQLKGSAPPYSPY
jgi:hypothetical protein